MADCSGLCLTGSDIGMPEYGSAWYAIDPDCPEHGVPMSPEEEEQAAAEGYREDPWADEYFGPCPCGDFDAADSPDLCVCGHYRSEHKLCADGTSWWCEHAS